MSGILKNQVKCIKCGEIIESVIAAEKVVCKCGTTTISGGKQILIREGQYEELSTFLLTE